ncbi:hypothetical protein [Streptomyces sp. A012304]|uniref:hypothetical protein n=1 Tax=Streptomyces sp. A012304 TaxID=375446 RepID=UPI0022304DB0|nr:hypothetical protein [Streptomyces sp. A012304]GKQ34071.1 hypothetical protein ALMP_06220 [Streptomyces sp. A012304]
MSESQQGHHHHVVHDIVERITEHHEQAVRRREEEALAEAVETATFDLGTDIAHPTAGHDRVSYDVETDLGVDGELAERRA